MYHLQISRKGDDSMTAPPLHKLSIHADTKLHGKVIVDSPFRNYGGTYLNLTAGAFSYIANGCFLYHVDIGRYCSIGDNVHILSQHPTDTLSTSPVFYQALFDEPFIAKQMTSYERLVQTKIGNDVWIGSGVKIKTGVTIGDGAVIGAGSVVTKNVAPFSIVGGTPAKLIKMRFSSEIIERIQALEWWNYNLIDYALDWSDLDATLTMLEKMKASGEMVPYVGLPYQLWNEDGKIVGKPV
jgi:acetyltransferase-like isoleucine patch superfamily enzyme